MPQMKLLPTETVCQVAIPASLICVGIGIAYEGVARDTWAWLLLPQQRSAPASSMRHVFWCLAASRCRSIASSGVGVDWARHRRRRHRSRPVRGSRRTRRCHHLRSRTSPTGTPRQIRRPRSRSGSGTPWDRSCNSRRRTKPRPAPTSARTTPRRMPLICSSTAMVPQLAPRTARRAARPRVVHAPTRARARDLANVGREFARAGAYTCRACRHHRRGMGRAELRPMAPPRASRPPPRAPAGWPPPTRRRCITRRRRGRRSAHRRCRARRRRRRSRRRRPPAQPAPRPPRAPTSSPATCAASTRSKASSARAAWARCTRPCTP
jgi:hypothetical protein